MAHQQTLGKCCYCGQKTLLQSKDVNCASCGAPLTKFMSLDALKSPLKPKIEPIVVKGKKPKLKSAKPHKKHSPNRKKSGLKRMFDLIDDVVDIFD